MTIAATPAQVMDRKAISKKIGDNISFHVCGQHITQAELAKRLGLDPALISQWRNGRSAPNVMTLTKIARAIGCNVTDLVEGIG